MTKLGHYEREILMDVTFDLARGMRRKAALLEDEVAGVRTGFHGRLELESMLAAQALRELEVIARYRIRYQKILLLQMFLGDPHAADEIMNEAPAEEICLAQLLRVEMHRDETILGRMADVRGHLRSAMHGAVFEPVAEAFVARTRGIVRQLHSEADVFIRLRRSAEDAEGLRQVPEELVEEYVADWLEEKYAAHLHRSLGIDA